MPIQTQICTLCCAPVSRTAPFSRKPVGLIANKNANLGGKIGLILLVFCLFSRLNLTQLCYQFPSWVETREAICGIGERRMNTP